MAVKEYAAFPKAPVLLKPHHQIVGCHIQDTRLGESYLSAEMQLMYSTAPDDWTKQTRYKPINIRIMDTMVHYWSSLSFLQSLKRYEVKEVYIAWGLVM